MNPEVENLIRSAGGDPSRVHVHPEVCEDNRLHSDWWRRNIGDFAQWSETSSHVYDRQANVVSVLLDTPAAAAPIYLAYRESLVARGVPLRIAVGNLTAIREVTAAARSVGELGADPLVELPLITAEDASRAARARLTTYLSEELLESVKNAVWHTPGETLTSFAELALKAELTKREKKRGEPFPPREGEIRAGAPMKSASATA